MKATKKILALVLVLMVALCLVAFADTTATDCVGPHGGPGCENQEPYGDSKNDIKADCTHAGQLQYHCTLCNYIYYVTDPKQPATGHTLSGDSVVVTNPGCETPGVKSLGVCSECGEEVTEEIEPQGHYYGSNEWVNHEATCTEDEYKTNVCINCGETQKETMKGTALGHAWAFPVIDEDLIQHPSIITSDDYYKVQTSPTCNEQGTISFVWVCTRCGAYDEDLKTTCYVPAANHDLAKVAEYYGIKREKETDSLGNDIYVLKNAETVLEILKKNCSPESKTPTTANGITTYILNSEVVDCTGSVQYGDKPIEFKYSVEYGAVTVEYKPATCEAKGYMKFSCAECGHEYTLDFDALGHNYKVDDYYVANKLISKDELDCTVENNALMSCERCGATKNQNYPAADKHEFNDSRILGYYQKQFADAEEVFIPLSDAKEKLATCYDYKIVYGCTHLNGECTGKNIVEKAGTGKHTALKYIIDTPATCETAGVRMFNCDKCGYPVTVKNGDPTDHSNPLKFVKWIKEPSCLEGGIREVKCTNKGCTYSTTEEVPAIGHQYVVAEEKASDCLKGVQGYTKYECSVCKDSFTLMDPTYGHKAPDSKKDWVAYTAPTCAADGSGSYWCEKCHTLQTVTYPKYNHIYPLNNDALLYVDGVKTFDQDLAGKTALSYADCTDKEACAKYAEHQPTCATGKEHGMIQHVTCALCSYKAYEEKISTRPTSHLMYAKGTGELNRFYIVTLPTCTSTGEARYVCACCSEQLSMELPKLPHNEQTKLNSVTNAFEVRCCKLEKTEGTTLKTLLSTVKGYSTAEGKLNLVGFALFEQMLKGNGTYFYGFENDVVVKTLEVVKPAYSISGKTDADGYTTVTLKNTVDGAEELDTIYLRVSYTYDLSDGTSYSYRAPVITLTKTNNCDAGTKSWSTDIGASDTPEGATFTGVIVVVCDNKTAARAQTIADANAGKYGLAVLK